MKSVNKMSEKNIKIQMNCLTRMIKEINYYQTEIAENETKLQNMKRDEKDIYDIKKQEEILNESYEIRFESIKKLKMYRENLESISVELELENKKNVLLDEINKLLQLCEFIM
jgi:hypothetical protein